MSLKVLENQTKSWGIIDQKHHNSHIQVLSFFGK